jgi:hypothetical protein
MPELCPTISSTSNPAATVPAAPVTTTTSAPPPVASNDYSPTALQLGIAILVLGSSAGMTLYTKKTGAMLSRMNQITENQLRRSPPKRIGPPTKAEWEKLRPRFDKEDLF